MPQHVLQSSALRQLQRPPALRSAAPDSPRHPAARLLQLQRIVGNQVVQRTLIEPRSHPVWGTEDKDLGGSSMQAIIGAEQGESDYGLPTAGSAPATDTPPIITNVGKAGGIRYIAGHLLNQVLGGPGVNKNLTVLSKDANSNHSGKELKLKYIGTRAQLFDGISKRDAQRLGSTRYLHGAKYTVTVNGANPSDTTPSVYPAEKQLAKSITLKTEPIKQEYGTTNIVAWTDSSVQSWAKEATTTIQNVPPYPQSIGPYDQGINKYEKAELKNLSPQERQALHLYGAQLAKNPSAKPTATDAIRAIAKIKQGNKKPKNAISGLKIGKSNKKQSALMTTKIVKVLTKDAGTSRSGRKVTKLDLSELME